MCMRRSESSPSPDIVKYLFGRMILTSSYLHSSDDLDALWKPFLSSSLAKKVVQWFFTYFQFQYTDDYTEVFRWNQNYVSAGPTAAKSSFESSINLLQDTRKYF